MNRDHFVQARYQVLGKTDLHDLFENLSVNSLKGDLSNATTFKPTLFSLVNTFNDVWVFVRYVTVHDDMILLYGNTLNKNKCFVTQEVIKHVKRTHRIEVIFLIWTNMLKVTKYNIIGERNKTY